MTSSLKQEVHNISQYHQRRTEPRPQATCRKNLVKFSCTIFGRQTDRRMHRWT